MLARRIPSTHPIERRRPGYDRAMRLRWLRRESLGFAIGSLCFAIGVMSWYVDAVTVRGANVTLFVGSLFFTASAFVQLRLSGRWRSGAWKDGAAWDDWWAAAVQLFGTLCFNVSTAIAVWSRLGEDQTLRDSWQPDVVGSACFLLAGGLALVATTHRDSLWDPHARDWWSSGLNMIGAIAFAVAAIGAYVEPWTGQLLDVRADNVGTFVGSLCFFAAALLVRPPAPGLPPARP